MPSPRAVLHDLIALGLDPAVPYRVYGASGHLKVVTDSVENQLEAVETISVIEEVIIEQPVVVDELPTVIEESTEEVPDQTVAFVNDPFFVVDVAEETADPIALLTEDTTEEKITGFVNTKKSRRSKKSSDYTS